MDVTGHLWVKGSDMHGRKRSHLAGKVDQRLVDHLAVSGRTNPLAGLIELLRPP